MPIELTIAKLRELTENIPDTLTDEEIALLRETVKAIHKIYANLEPPERTMVLMMALSVEAITLPVGDLNSFTTMVSENNKELAKIIAIRQQMEK